MRKKISVLLESLVFLASLCIVPNVCLAAPAYDVTSPDGNLTITFALETKPRPYKPGERAYYRVSYKGKPVLIDSPLGLDFLDEKPLDQDFEVLKTVPESHDSTWQDHFGAQLEIPDRFHQLTVSLRERQEPHRRLDLIFRAYNEGVAFRYFLPQQAGLQHFSLKAENTGFYFPPDLYGGQKIDAYPLNIRQFVSPYEAPYPKIRLDEIHPSSIVPLPILIHPRQGPWIGLVEADLTDYAGMYVSGVPGIANALVSKLSPSFPSQGSPVIGCTPKATPWRALMINSRPGGLTESNYLVLNLNPPNAIGDTSWIHPGKVTFPWWNGFWGGNGKFQHNVNTAMFEYYIDFAAKHNLQYIEVSDFWYWSPEDGRYGVYHPDDDITRPAPSVDIAGVLQYAKQRGVKIILWLDWEALKKQIDVAFPLYEKWGVSGIKVDLMDRDDQIMVNFYREVAEKAAAHHLVVDFHGAYKPTGLNRTYPNVLNIEAVMGLEHDKLGGYGSSGGSNPGSELPDDSLAGEVTPGYDVTLPFTRMLVGPMDYTPGSFHNATRDQFKVQWDQPMSEGTRAHELAKYVVYQMPLAMVSDYPDAYLGQPAFEFIEKVPTVWDDTKVLNGEPHKFITVARKNGASWYIGSMTNWDARELKIPLDFLGGGSYQAKIFADGANAAQVATSVSISSKLVNKGDSLDLQLAPGGGAAVILTPTN